jgi:tetrahydromethanopterin S-methyltransferase subunit H
MDLRGIANASSDCVNPNISVTVKASTGYTIGSGLKQVPSYADPVTGFAQVQALTAADLRHLDGLNIQGATKSIILRGPLNAIVRVNSQGGDVVTIGTQTWLTVAVLEQWPLWSRCAIQLQDVN